MFYIETCLIDLWLSLWCHISILFKLLSGLSSFLIVHCSQRWPLFPLHSNCSLYICIKIFLIPIILTMSFLPFKQDCEYLHFFYLLHALRLTTMLSTRRFKWNDDSLYFFPSFHSLCIPVSYSLLWGSAYLSLKTVAGKTGGTPEKMYQAIEKETSK